MDRIKLAKLLTILVLSPVVLGTMPPCVHARGGARDPLVRSEQQRRRTEQRKTKRREDLDAEGAEMRDAKKSAQDSKQSQQLQNFGQPNQQTDRWTGF